MANLLSNALSGNPIQGGNMQRGTRAVQGVDYFQAPQINPGLPTLNQEVAPPTAGLQEVAPVEQGFSTPTDSGGDNDHGWSADTTGQLSPGQTGQLGQAMTGVGMLAGHPGVFLGGQMLGAIGQARSGPAGVINALGAAVVPGFSIANALLGAATSPQTWGDTRISLGNIVAERGLSKSPAIGWGRYGPIDATQAAVNINRSEDPLGALLGFMGEDVSANTTAAVAAANALSAAHNASPMDALMSVTNAFGTMGGGGYSGGGGYGLGDGPGGFGGGLGDHGGSFGGSGGGISGGLGADGGFTGGGGLGLGGDSGGGWGGDSGGGWGGDSGGGFGGGGYGGGDSDGSGGPSAGDSGWRDGGIVKGYAEGGVVGLTTPQLTPQELQIMGRVAGFGLWDGPGGFGWGLGALGGSFGGSGGGISGGLGADGGFTGGGGLGLGGDSGGGWGLGALGGSFGGSGGGIVKGYAEGGVVGLTTPQPGGYAPMQTPLSGKPSPQMVNMKINQLLSNPQVRQQLVARTQTLMQSGQLTPQELQIMGRVAEAALHNPQVYPQLRQFVAEQGMSPLPPAFDPSVIIKIIAISRAMQAPAVQATPPGVVPPTNHAAVVPPQGMAEGGVIHGPGTGRSDSIGTVNESNGQPVKVANGEYIIPKHVVDAKGREFFDNLLRRYAELRKGESS